MTTPLKPAALLNHGVAYLVVTAALLLLLIGIICLVVFLWKAKKPKKSLSRPRHVHDLSRDEWVERVHAITTGYHDDAITREQAFSQFARIARLFASERLGVNYLAHTLADIRKEPRTRAVTHFETLRQTIEALYPAEFTNPKSTITSESISVEDGEKWVVRLIEEWRA